MVAAFFGNLTLARQEATVAVEISRRIVNPSCLIYSLYGFALAYWESDPAAAESALKEAVQIANDGNVGFMPTRISALVSQLEARSGNPPAALRALKQALETAHITDDQSGIAVCLARGAAVMAALGEHETAAVFLAAVTNKSRSRRGVVSPNEIPNYSQFVTTLQSQLGDDRHTAAIARGAAMTYEQATVFAMNAIEHLQAGQGPKSRTSA
jgi:hypothetical protein